MSETHKVDYSETLNLPKTDFPMRANLPKKEPEILKFWEENQIYARVQQRAKENNFPAWILHDGPPYANGHIHIGHALNKTLKDIIVKYKSARGYFTPYIHGWDTHGLPIETRVIKDLGLNRHAVSTLEFRAKCRDYALKFAAIQRQEFERLGVWGNWDDSYYTLMPHYEAKQVEVFGIMAQKGYIYKGLKPVYWCTSCETALAEAEVEYADKRSPSIYVKFPLIDDQKLFGGEVANTYIVIWTTTPWTIPANLGICLHPVFEYVLVEVGDERFVVAAELLARLAQEFGWQDYQVRQKFVGRELERAICRHPLFDRESLVILGEHVTLEQGTGCVHTAPGHGEEDFIVGSEYGLPVLNPVDPTGHFTHEAGPYAGLDLDAGGKKVVEDLKALGALLKFGFVQHQFPHCWRCKEPIVFRATEQWFASVEGFREEALTAIKQVKWYPAWGENRISSMVRERRDWCISRQRVWGVPIPVFYCTECNEPIITEETIAAVRDRFAAEGSDAWFKYEASELLPPGFVCPGCGASTFRKETDIMDVWFDSGSSHRAVLTQWPDLRWPADMYLEGSDQHRGWFQSSLLTAVATTGQAPYRSVLTHGFIVDEQGRKMSKSLGNVVAPDKVIEQYGADILRLWVSSADYTDDIRVSEGILKQLSEVYRRIRNTGRFILGNLSDFNPDTDLVAYADLLEIDRFALHRLQEVLDKLTKAFDNYQFHVFYHTVHNYAAVDLGAFYLDVLKDRLYTSKADSHARRSAQTVLYHIINVLVRVISPVLTFTAEEMWQYLPQTKDKPLSVQLTSWPEVRQEYLDPELAEKWNRILAVREEVNRALEAARNAKMIGNSLEAKVVLYSNNPQLYELLAGFADELATIFIVSAAEVAPLGLAAPPEALPATDGGLAIMVERAPGEKCERCWVYSPQLGVDANHPKLCPRCTDVVTSD
ncbi:MAG: isoleucine--tRNA ligase [Firmicutes bacterium]|nr:isoleucine--tRNA ligase [Bacillota bacterium]